MGRWTAAPALNPLDTTSLLTGLGALGVIAVIFAETGLLIGFFLLFGLPATNVLSV
ncbi:hypothetical protein OH809_29290 [Streptomyces sp. NBC_00873]|uniref:hypothetical protein n=1 Tax=Streptomyces sp. NBC_00873 TaxID=2975852 RepID=UPI00386D2238|nr:hypothetical protein OH809_29290 [Streptomyces sp. NBC_00873]